MHGRARLQHLLDGRAPLPAGGYRAHPEPADDGDASLRDHQKPQDRLRLQHRADDYAMADILTGGRVIFGVDRGYHTREVETFGSPLMDQAANREMFEEGVDVIFKAFAGKPFSHKGKYYT